MSLPPPPAAVPLPPPTGDPTPSRRPRVGLWVVVVTLFALVLGGGGGAAAFLLFGDDGDEKETAPEDKEPTVELVLEEARAEGRAAFVDATDTVIDAELSADAVDEADSLNEEFDTDDAGARVADGSAPGLYGGTMSQQACDSVGLVDFLAEHDEEAAAWAEAQDIDVDEIEGYVTTLTPVLLTADTWVTNHGFEDGEATPFQSVLQRGTAVLIDEHGVPRVRCACGNPLLEPEQEGIALDSAEGETWDDFDAEQIRVVEEGEEAMEAVELLDIETGETFERGVGGGQTGEIQVTLQWSTGADLDVHVIDPIGDEVYFSNDQVDSGGWLDVDMIPGCYESDGSQGSRSIENIFWDDSVTPPPGEYTAFVKDYSGCGVSSDYQMQVFVGGVLVHSETGTLTDGEESPYFTFTVDS
ncbi:MAG: hypothetical protein QM621_06480 [Aeromicrobium sp.]|uniref:DUF6777 domain-containing protein n=1 Tax=Aeromicrobium sp. TaxID=1871063 RepID=UPI0039E3F913